MVRVVLAKHHEVEERAAGFRPEFMTHEKRASGSTPWEASTIAAFDVVHEANSFADGRAPRQRARAVPRVDGYLLQLVVEALAGAEAAAASEAALQGRLDVYTGEDKTDFACAEFMRALHHAGGAPVRRLWRGLEMIVGVVSLYTLAADTAGAIGRSRFEAAVDKLLETERLGDEQREELDTAIEIVWERHDVFLSAGLGAQVKLPEMLRVAIDTVSVDGSTSSTHTWATDDEMNECEDCGQQTNVWCKHCEACKHCDDMGDGHMCSVASAYQHVLRLAAANWYVRSVWRKRTIEKYDADGATGLQLYQAVLKATGQNCLVVEAIDADSASTNKGVRVGMMLCSCQGQCTIGLQQHEMLYLPLDERPLELVFVECSVRALAGDSRHSALEDIAKRKAAAKAREQARKRAAWKRRRGKVVVSNVGADAASSLAYKALSEPKFDSRSEPYNRPISREFTRKWATNFVGARQLRESSSKAPQDYLEAGSNAKVPKSNRPATVGYARQVFSATRMMKPGEHIDRLDSEYSQYLSVGSKKSKSSAEGHDYIDEPFDEVHERSHQVYLPRSLQDSMRRMPAEMEAVLTHGYHQRRTLKSLVSKKLRRYTSYGFDLNLTYIMPNVIAMGFPAEGREATYRNQMTEVQRFLNTRHPNEYRVYNLCSERNYPAMRFKHRDAPEGSVCCYPFDDHNPPTLNLMKQCCEDMRQWLGGDRFDPDDSHVCVVHCKAGKGRTGTIIAAYLLLAGEFDSATEALEYFGHCRTLDAKGVTIPSQIRYVHYFERWLKSPNFGELPTATITLNKIRLIGVPDFAGDGSCTPYFVIPKGYRDETGAEVEYDLRHRLAAVRAGDQRVERVVASEPYIDFDTELQLSGDVCMVFCHAEARGGAAKMCQVWLHTAFIHSDKVVIPKAHIDIACKDKHCKQFRSNFAIELHFDVHRNAPEPLAHDHSTGYTVYTAVAEQAKDSDSPNLSADSATLLSRRTLHARRGEPAPAPRLVAESDSASSNAIATREAHQAVRKMKRRPGTPIDMVRQSLEFYAIDTNGT
jgi:phosphatidylinositol-3,4,5-trisphosphate 3-phosphatase/dual-specificity protein phosphatase PTEN